MLFYKFTFKYKNLSEVATKSLNFFLSKSNLFYTDSFKLSTFFREGFFIDELQRNTMDKVIRKLFISSTQFFNINFYNYKFIKFFIDDLYKLTNNLFGDYDDKSISFVLQSLLFVFFLFTNVIVSLYLTSLLF